MAKSKQKVTGKASAKLSPKDISKDSAKKSAKPGSKVILKPSAKAAATKLAPAKPTHAKPTPGKLTSDKPPAKSGGKEKTAKALVEKRPKMMKDEGPDDDGFDDHNLDDEFSGQADENIEAVLAEVAPPPVVDNRIDIEIEIDESNAPEEIVLTDADGRRYCKVKDCDQYAVVEDHCRFHYLLLWKRIQVRRKILIDGKLERYVEELTARYPDKFLEMIRKDLRSEKDFLTAIAELEIDESAIENDYEDENSNFIDEVRGMSTESSSMSDDDDF